MSEQIETVEQKKKRLYQLQQEVDKEENLQREKKFQEAQRHKKDFIEKTGIEFYGSHDYIGLKAGRFEFYYGYQRILCPIHGKSNENHCKDENGFDVECDQEEWAFTVEDRGKEIMRLASSEIESMDSRYLEIIEKLVVGIALFFTTKNVRPSKWFS